MTKSAEKIPPQNLDAEMAILGSCFLSSYALDKVCEEVTEDMFFSDANKKIFSAIESELKVAKQRYQTKSKNSKFEL